LVVDNVTSNLTSEELLEWLEKKNAEMEIKDHTLDYANIPYEKSSQALEELKSKKLKGIPLTDLEKLTLLKSVFKSFYIIL
jgi:tryptophan synthase alpha subunit